MDLEPGTVVASRYRITHPLGRGGMGEVYAAENVRTGRKVAVKLLRADSKAKSSAVKRFEQEARAAGTINSDHVTQVFDVCEDEEHGIVIVFELLEGESLIDRLKRGGPIPLEELHPYIEQVWLGLADAHRAGIIHRDLKPSNVFLERRPDGHLRAKILDFGISKVPKEMGGETLTEMGQSLGTFS
ncbi:MAG: serine/threonine protein kinase, partial [Polyangiaceae bacterium]|nr:serine/threonine protein kinase [Polyangiaceae bacterium]